jgi:hypothetical protein
MNDATLAREVPVTAGGEFVPYVGDYKSPLLEV